MKRCPRAVLSAGLASVSFQLEPIAAVLDYEQGMTSESLVLVVDIGGGTSDFTVVRLSPERMQHKDKDRSGDVLANTGVHIGDTDSDHSLSLELLIPLLGFRHLGTSGREVPSGVFSDFSTWHLMQWVYSQRAVRDAQNLKTEYADACLHARLMRVVNERFGHRMADTVEQAKIAAFMGGIDVPIPLHWISSLGSLLN